MNKKRLFTAAARILFAAVLILGLETWGWLHVDRPFDSFVPSWRFHHIRKPNSSQTARSFFAFNPAMISRFPASARWEFNEHGWLHDKGFPVRKATDTYRIFYLGDSFTEGHTLSEDSMPAVVRRQLASRFHNDGVQLEVINAGIVGCSPALYYIQTRYKIMDVEPDLLVVNIDMTDDLEEWSYRERMIEDEEGNPLALPFLWSYLASEYDDAAGVFRATWATRAILLLHSRSYFFNYLLYIRAVSEDAGGEANQVPETALYERWAWCREEWDERTEQTVSAMFEMIERLVIYCRRRGVKVMLTGVPHYRQYHADKEGLEPPDQSDRPHRELEKLAANLGVPYLNSHQTLKSHIEGRRQSTHYFDGDIHFNAAGNRLWGREQVSFLVDPANGLLP